MIHLPENESDDLRAKVEAMHHEPNHSMAREVHQTTVG